MTTKEQKKKKSDYMKKWRDRHIEERREIEKKRRATPKYKKYMYEYIKEYRKRFPEKHKALRDKHRDKQVERKRREKRNDKELVYSHYGKKCVCCGEEELMFLTIDHINNDGSFDRKNNGSHIYRRLIKDGFPNGFQVLCRNCNWGKHINGGICPHKNKS